MSEIIQKMQEQPKAIKIAAGALTAVALFGGFKGCEAINDDRHPYIGVGVNDEDVRELGELLENSRLSAYNYDGPHPYTASNSLMSAVIRFQASNDIENKDIGHVKHGDDTWNKLEDSQIKNSDIPKGMPAECYELQDVICVGQDTAKAEGTLNVIHNGRLKDTIESVGVGGVENPTDVGSFTINPGRRYETGYFSKSYDSVPMPMAQFFNGGEAIHFSRAKAEMGDEYPGSKGCVTIGDFKVAEQLFDYVTQVQDQGNDMHVVVYDK